MRRDVEILDEETAYDGFFELKRFRLRHSLYSGGWSRVLMRERVERKRAVAVLLYDPVSDQVVLIEQFRIGALEAGQGAWMLEIVGGLIETGEAPEEVAHREAMEEAGCEVMALLPICEFYVSPGTATEYLHLYCGRVDASRAGGVHGLEEEGEDIRVEVMSSDAAIAELCNGRANSTSIIVALQWLAMHREAIRKAWGDAPG